MVKLEPSQRTSPSFVPIHMTSSGPIVMQLMPPRSKKKSGDGCGTSDHATPFQRCRWKGMAAYRLAGLSALSQAKVDV